jgi:lysophospholipase L1-like esterase
VLCNAQNTGLKLIPVDGTGIRVYGLYFFDYSNPLFQRLDDSTKYREKIWELSKLPAGARVRFKTNSTKLFFPLKNLTSYAWKNTSLIGWGGCDVYINNKYFISITYDNVDTLDLKELADGSKINSVDLYLPNYGTAAITQVGIDSSAQILPPDDYDDVILFYGTSITQGASADRASNSFPALISRELNADFYNFGFSGNGKGEEEIQNTLSSIEADLYVLKYSLQADNGNTTKQNLIDFVTKIKTKHPDAAVLIISAFHHTPEEYNPSVRENTKQRRDDFFTAYNELKNTYSRIYFEDGLNLIGPDDDDTLADGVHPNTYGFKLAAQRILPLIRNILQK